MNFALKDDDGLEILVTDIYPHPTDFFIIAKLISIDCDDEVLERAIDKLVDIEFVKDLGYEVLLGFTSFVYGKIKEQEEPEIQEEPKGFYFRN